MCFIKCEISGYSLEIKLSHSLLCCFRICTSCFFKGLNQDVRRIICQSGEHAWIFIIFFLVVRNKLCQCITCIHGCIGCCKEYIVQVLVSCQLHKVGRIESVTADDWYINSHFTSLLDNQTYLIIIAWDIDHIKVHSLDFCQLYVEIGILCLIVQLGYDVSAFFLEFILECF